MPKPHRAQNIRDRYDQKKHRRDAEYDKARIYVEVLVIFHVRPQWVHVHRQNPVSN